VARPRPPIRSGAATLAIQAARSLVFLNVPTMQQSEAHVGHADKLFDEHGKLASDGARKFLQEFMQAFANWVETIRSQGQRI
jgi:chromate reductase